MISLRFRTVARLCLSLLLISSVVIGSTGTAAADTELSDDCGVANVALGGLWNVANPDVDCGIYDDSAETRTKVDAYANAKAMNERRNALVTQRENLLQDARSIMWMKGKVGAVEALNDGANKSEAKRAFNESVNDYTSMLIVNDMRKQEADAVQTAYLVQSIGGTNTSTPTIGGSVPDPENNGEPGLYIYAVGSTATGYYQLPNQDIIKVALPVAADGGTGNAAHIERVFFKAFDPAMGKSTIGDNPGQVTVVNRSWSHGSLEAKNYMSIGVVNPETGYETSAVSSNAYVDVIDSYLSNANQVKANGAGFIERVYPKLESGELSTADLLDPTTLASEAATEYNSTGYYAYQNTALSALGLTGNGNVTHVVNTQLTLSDYQQGTNTTNASYQEKTVNATIEGSIYMTGSDNLTLETGQTYQPSNLPGTVYMTVANVTNRDTGAELDGVSGTTRLTEPFTIVSATNAKTGESVNVTSAQDKNYETTNLTELKQELEDLKRLQQELQDSQSVGGGDGGSSSTEDDPNQSGLNPAAIVLLVAGASLLALLLQQKGGRQ